MTIVGRLCSSIVVQVTGLTVGAIILMVFLMAVSMQTPVAHVVFPRALSDNADSIAELVWLVEKSPAEVHPFILSAYQGVGRVASIGEGFGAGLDTRTDLEGELTEAESDAAIRLDGRDIRFEILRAFALRRRMAEEGVTGLRAVSALQIAIALESGSVLNVWLAPTMSLGTRPVLLFSLGTSLVLFAAALGLAIASVMIRPIHRLEEDAENLELGEVGAGISQSGPIELRRLSAALDALRKRMSALIREREQMVAAIAHDVRTGLTRIRLRLDQSDTGIPDELEADLRQVEHLITDMLTYARAESPDGQRELIELSAFIRSVADNAPHAIALSIADDTPFEIAGDPIALRRLFENLLENARRYGGGEISMAISRTPAGLSVAVNDDGPGLPDHELEAVFQPFRRLESSRNRATGGTGLGLGIARAIARAHGASLKLQNRPQGGLAAVVHFPDTLQT